VAALGGGNFHSALLILHYNADAFTRQLLTLHLNY